MSPPGPGSSWSGQSSQSGRKQKERITCEMTLLYASYIFQTKRNVLVLERLRQKLHHHHFLKYFCRLSVSLSERKATGKRGASEGSTHSEEPPVRVKPGPKDLVFW